MIRHENWRNGEHQNTYHETEIEALRNLVVWELGWGGIVTELSPERVAVRTGVLHCEDLTLFAGSAQEMALIARIAAIHLALTSDPTSHEAIINNAVRQLEMLPDGVGNVPLYISMVAPELLGGLSARVALILALDENPEESWFQISLNDLVTAVEFHLEDNVPFSRVIEILELNPIAA